MWKGYNYNLFISIRQALNHSPYLVAILGLLVTPELVVVPLCFELKLIKHKGAASLSNVGLCKMSMPTLAKRTKPDRKSVV